MTHLMIHTPDGNEGPTEKTVFGGRPSAPAGAIEWPTCATCHGNMQFLGQLQATPDQLLLLFMCQNDPGCCEEWDPDAGGNKVVTVSTENLELVAPPEGGETLRETRYGAAPASSDKPDFYEALEAWVAESGRSQLDVLGQMGG